MSISDFLDEYFENPRDQGLSGRGLRSSAPRLGRCRPARPMSCLHHAMGDVDGNVGAWGFARGGMGSITKALTASLQATGGEVRVGPRRRADPGQERPRHRRGAGEWRRGSGQARRVQHGREAHLPETCRGDGTARRFRQAGQKLQDPRLIGQAEHRAGPRAEIHRPAGRLAAHEGRHAFHRFHREDGARL